jgi:hypothetical protein
MSATPIWERLWVGSIFDAEALADSNPQRITTIITLSPEAAPEELSGINHVYLPLLGDRPIPVEIFSEIMDAMWENIRWGTLFLQSFDGTNRAPVLAAAWIHCCGYKTIDAALAEVGKLRTIEPHPILLKSIKELV